MNAFACNARWLVFFSLLWAGTAISGDFSADVDGVTAYLGVVPAEIARASNTPHVGPERDAHGRVISSGASHHVVIALFDSATGVRIENAEVSATLVARGKYQTSKHLDPMRINDTVSYGNVFDLSGGDEYRVDVEIRLPERDRPVKVSFRYRDPRGGGR